ncbi:LysR family transcriptional regulator [Alphaproteobacteria bacterium GH1-50]|uniref:LysR family transcriptional regulator n=1 Tax=Kangsaoukella pontilimi TaxID=2691042 RepID=A0A7C9ISN7_9RHOB|nr:LysR family transcriptional regulator [Kangsaoukella pontilimi]MXQ08145.1 LysR family transcriptional regulator [Kangsaoukella pontilimi]
MNVQTSPKIPLLELDLLNTLVAIAETGSFSAAAQAIFRTPSAISMQVKRMEELLGRPVFVRDSRSVSLTADGAFLVEHARRMLAMNNEAVARFVQPDLKGVVRLGATDDVAERFLPPMLRRFADSHPGVSVNVTVADTVGLRQDLNTGRLDMALVVGKAEDRDAFGAEVLMEEQLVWAARRCGTAASREPLPVSVWEEGCAWRISGLKGLDAQGRPWRIAFQSAHISGQKAAILADLAVAPLPAATLSGDIVEAPAKYGLPRLPKYVLGLMVRSDPSPAIEAAADHLRASFPRD